MVFLLLEVESGHLRVELLFGDFLEMGGSHIGVLTQLVERVFQVLLVDFLDGEGEQFLVGLLEHGDVGSLVEVVLEFLDFGLGVVGFGGGDGFLLHLHVAEVLFEGHAGLEGGFAAGLVLFETHVRCLLNYYRVNK